MKMNFVKSLMAVSVASVLTAPVMATVDLDAGTGANTYASELNYNSAAAGTAITNPATEIGSTVKLGFGVSSGQTRYIRFDLTNGKFNAAITAAYLTNATTAFGATVVVAGGAAADSYVIFQVTGAAGNHTAADVLNFTNAGLAVDATATSAPVRMTYTLHETAVSATAGVTGTSVLANKAADLVKFSKGLKFTIDNTYNTTADVEKAFKEFVASSGGNTAVTDVAELGVVTYGVNAVDRADSTAVALTDLVTAASKLVVKGDFTASGANDIFLSAANDCSVATVGGTLNTAKTEASVTVGTTAYASHSICYEVNTTTAVPAQVTTVGLDVTAATGTTSADVADATFGEISRNGTELQSPWFTVFSGYISRFVLTSQHSADAAYTATCLTEDGVVATSGSGAAGTLKAGKALVIDAANVCSFDVGTRGAVVFTIAAPNSKIQGVYNVVKADTGSISVSNMMRPGTN